MSLAALGMVVLLAGLIAYVRLAPTNAAVWHVDLTGRRPPGIAAADGVQVLPNGAWADLRADPTTAALQLSRLDSIALATPRTRPFAGSAAEGHVTWESRSLIWGFPDYTTAEITPSGLSIYARQRFGGNDWGVNAQRLRGWLSQLAAAGT